jgi:hypothetical protein
MSAKKKKSQKQAKSIKIIEQSLFQHDQIGKNAEKHSKKTKKKAEIRSKKSFSTVAELLNKRPIQETNKYITQEFQAFGCHMATVLGDQTHTSLYIKLAKTYPRALLEQALAFVSDAQNARSKAKLFMWKLDQLKKNRQEKKNIKKTAGEK